MTSSEALRQLRAHTARLSRDYGVADLAVFGSVARNDADTASDIDVLVKFDGPATSKRYFGVQLNALKQIRGTNT